MAQIQARRDTLPDCIAYKSSPRRHSMKVAQPEHGNYQP
jgi:hypothetical protein